MDLMEESADMSAFNTFGWINDIAGKYKRTKPILTPRFIPSCTDDLMDQLREIQRAYSLPVQSHLSENKGEIEWVRELRPDSLFYGDSYDKHNLFGDENLDSEKVNTVMAHCVWSSDEEVNLMRENGVFIAHPLELSLRQRIERSIYLSLDMCGGIKEKYVQGNKII